MRDPLDLASPAVGVGQDITRSLSCLGLTPPFASVATGVGHRFASSASERLPFLCALAALRPPLASCACGVAHDAEPCCAPVPFAHVRRAHVPRLGVPRVGRACGTCPSFCELP